MPEAGPGDGAPFEGTGGWIGARGAGRRPNRGVVAGRLAMIDLFFAAGIFCQIIDAVWQGNIPCGRQTHHDRETWPGKPRPALRLPKRSMNPPFHIAPALRRVAGFYLRRAHNLIRKRIGAVPRAGRGRGDGSRGSAAEMRSDPNDSFGPGRLTISGADSERYNVRGPLRPVARPETFFIGGGS